MVYHVQTEDKGINTPLILSLVYRDGAILASKRTPYDDLLVKGFDEALLTKRLQRQHKLICAAVHAGRIAELKQLSERDAERRHSPQPEQSGDDAPAQIENPAADSEQDQVGGRVEPSEVTTSRFPISEHADEEAFRVSFLEEPVLRGGESVTLRVLVTRRGQQGQLAVAKARVTLKVLGSSFRSESTITTSDHDGVALLFARLPKFNRGRAAILVRAESEGETAELRRIILPA